MSFTNVFTKESKLWFSDTCPLIDQNQPIDRE